MSEMERAADAPDYGHDVERGLLVCGEGRADYLDLVAEALGEEGTDGPVGHPGDEGAMRARSALTAEEASRYLPSRVHPLFEVDGEREEVDAFPGFAHRGRDQQDAVAVSYDDGAAGLLSELPGLKREKPAADLAAN